MTVTNDIFIYGAAIFFGEIVFLVAIKMLVTQFKKKRGYKMLILTRRIEESIKIGDDITISVLAIKGNQIRLGINAPKEISVHREEIYNRIQAQEGANKDD